MNGIIENLQNPVPSWLFFLLVVILVVSLNKKSDKPGTQVSKKENFKTKLSKLTYKMPSQKKFDISIYGKSTVDNYEAIREKLTTGLEDKTVWKEFSIGEQKALLLSHFEYIQQFLNIVDENFIIEKNDDPYGDLTAFDSMYEAIKLDIFRGEERIGKIEVEPSLFRSEPQVALNCRLNYADMFEYQPLYNLFYRIASVHFDDENPSIEQKSEASINSKLTEYLWNRMNSKTHAEYDGFDWHTLENLEMSFSGQFKAYSRFRKIVLDEENDVDVFEREYADIKNLMDHFGYEEL